MADCSGLPSLVRPRNIRIRPGSLSVRKMSPFGAVRRVRGLIEAGGIQLHFEPQASAEGQTFSGRATSFGPFSED